MGKIKYLVGVCVIIFSSLQASAQDNTDSLTSKVNTLLSDAADKGLFSGVVILTQNGKVIYKKQAGYANWQNRRPVNDATLYNIGSVTKQFTEEMIRQLVKENKLTYEDHLSKYMDIFPPEIGRKITINQLLDMRSGLGDYFGSAEFHRIELTDFSLGDILNIIKHQPLLFEPGTNQRYSNSGYAVLGAIIEKITGKTYEENLRKRIAMPLNMKNIYYTKAEKAAHADRAFGHIISVEGDKIPTDDISNGQPAGGVYTDVHDLLTFAEAKGAGRLPSAYNYHLPATFAGGTPLWSSVISYGNKGITFVVMSNIGGSAEEIATRISSILKGDNYLPFSFPFVVTLYQTLKEKGAGFIEQHIHELCEQQQRPYNDQFLNFYGYQLLQNGKLDMAIELFKLNAKLFPDVLNVYDSLGEAYLQNNDRSNALKNYRKVLEIDPSDQHAKDIIKQISD